MKKVAIVSIGFFDIPILMTYSTQLNNGQKVPYILIPEIFQFRYYS